MEPDLDQLLEKLRDANERLSQAFIQQSIAWNNVSSHLRHIREEQPTLFTQNQEH